MNDILKKRWDIGPTNPNGHSPSDCLEVALHRLKEGYFEYAPTHVIVVFGHIDPADGCARTSFLQAGNLDAFAQVGLLDAAIALMRYNDRDD